MDDGNVIPPWSDLPKELVERIGQCLDTHIDVLRFRAVCTTWRSSIPPFKASPSLPLKLPSHGIRYLGWADFYLIESTVYLFQPLDDAYIGSSCRSWLVKVTQTLDGKMRVMNPVTDKQINPFKPPNDGQTKVLPYNMPKVLNLLDFRVSQVCKSYHAQRSRPLFNDYDTGNLFNKILLSTNHICNETNHYSLLAILQTGQLSYFNSGDEQWIKLKDASCSIVDIIVYKGKFYAVDQYGKTIKFDSSFNETIVSSFLCVGGTRRRLVESLEHLYLVDIVLDTAYDNPLLQNTLGIKMYRLDEEQHDWIAVHTLGDRIFFAGDDCCFSVSSQVFGDGRGNCIYYANNGTLMGENDDRLQKRGYLRKDFRPNVGEGESSCNERHSKGLVHRYKGLHHNTGVFIIEDGKLGSLLSFFNCAEIFWPPPSRLNQARSEALDAIHSSLSPIQTLSSEVADYQKKLLALEDSVANSTSQYRLFNHKSNGPLLHEKLEAPLNPTKDLSRLLAEHKYEEAFTAALQRNDASVLWWLCSQVDLRGFLSINPLPLSRGVLLSLLQQLACDVSKETSQKLSCMTDVLSCMLDMPTQK